jgi:predicted transposase YbfD/YdcC
MSTITVFEAAFEALEDPRARNSTYPLINIVFMAFVGMVCGADDWSEVTQVCVSKRDLLRQWLDFNGVPSPDTFERIFSMLDPEQFSECMTNWVLGVTGSLKGLHLAGDGKTQRASIRDALAKDPFHATSLFVVDEQLFLSVAGTHGSGYEARDLRRALDQLCLKGTYVTLDALHTNTPTAQLLAQRGAWWILGLKGNCPARLAEVVELFQTSQTEQGHRTEQTNKGHGRVETRRAWALELEGDWFGNQKEWGGVRSVMRIERERWVQAEDKTQHEVHYFLSNLPAAQVEKQAQLIREHWAIENNGHWHLDVLLNEDRSRARKKNAAANMAVLKRIVLNALRRTKVGPTALKRKRLRAALEDRYLLRVLNSL